MRAWIVVAALIVVAACKGDDKQAPASDNKSPAPAPAPAPAPDLTRPPPACTALVSAYEQMIACEPTEEGKSMGRQVVEQLPMLWQDVTAASYPMVARGCALQLDQAIELAKEIPCTLTIDAETQRLVDAERNRRTTVPPSGVAAADAVVTKLQALRDRACACKDRACGDAVSTEADALPLGDVAQAPQATRDAAGLVVDELGACVSRLGP